MNTDAKPRLPLTVYYDKSCPLSRLGMHRVMELLLRRRATSAPPNPRV